MSVRPTGPKRGGRIPASPTEPPASPTSTDAGRGLVPRRNNEVAPDANITGRSRNILPVGVAVDGWTHPVRFKLVDEHKLDVPEPSGITFLSDKDGFLIASDCEKKLYSVGFPDADRNKVHSDALKADGGKKHMLGLEGVAYDASSRSVLVVSEDRNEVSEVPLDRRDMELGEARKLGKLPDITRISNKGWEGVAVLPAQFSPDGKSRLIAVHEAAPRRLAVLNRDTLEAEAVLKLPDEMKHSLADLSDVTVDPKTGHVFILSDESATVYEAALDVKTKPGTGGMLKQSWGLTPVGKTELPDADGKTRLQPEGITFDAKGDLWIVAERKQSMFHFERQ